MIQIPFPVQLVWGDFLLQKRGLGLMVLRKKHLMLIELGVCFHEFLV